jgi:hypothetical protein
MEAVPAPQHPLPAAAKLTAPDAAEVAMLGRGILSAISVDGRPTQTQSLLVAATLQAMTGHEFDTSNFEPIDAGRLADVLAPRTLAFRTRIVQGMILGALVLRPLPAAVADRVSEFATAVSVDDGMLAVAHELADDHLGLAALDFDRNGYASEWSPERSSVLHAHRLGAAWQFDLDDPELAAQWATLADLGAGTLGREVWEFYRARGFEFPGLPGSAPPLLAQHDWVHVLVDYGTKVESELEVFAFIARANDDPRGFSLLAMVVSLFETGYLAHGAGLFDAFPGQLSHPGMAVRVADAMRRGASSHGLDGAADVDLLAVDWFSLADRPVADLRAAFGIVGKSSGAVAAGSVGPWEPGGISGFQFATGQSAAQAAGRQYDAHGATP